MANMADHVNDERPPLDTHAFTHSTPRRRSVYLVECYDQHQKRWQPWPDGEVAMTLKEARSNVAWLEHDHGRTGLRFRVSAYQRVTR